MKVYSAYDPPPKPAAREWGPSLTRQSEAGSCDINQIMARYEKTGIIPVNQREAFFADVSNMGDYRTALNNVAVVNDFFAELPASVRAEFSNDVGEFLDFCSDDSNREKMVELGLIESVDGLPPEEPAVEAKVDEPVPPTESA